MSAAINILRNILSFFTIIVIAIIVIAYIRENRITRKLRKQYRTGQTVYFYAGHIRHMGFIKKIESKRVKIQSLYNGKIYYTNYHSINKL